MIAFAPQKLTQGMFLITSLCLMCPFYLCIFTFLYLEIIKILKLFAVGFVCPIMRIWICILVAHKWQIPSGPLQKCLWRRHLSWCCCNKYLLWRHKNCRYKHWLCSSVYIFFLKIFRKHGYLILAAMSISDIYPIWIPWSISLTFFYPLSLTFSLWN